MLPPTTLIALGTIALLLILIGVVSGWIISTPTNPKKSTLKTLVAVAVTFVWIIATIADIFIAAYSVSILIHALMGGLVGYFFTDEGITFNIGGE